MVMNAFPEPYFAAIGRVVVGWSRIEHSFDRLFLRLVVMRGAPPGSMKDPNVKKMGVEFKRRIKLFRHRVRELNLPVEKQKQIKNVLDRLLVCRKARDEIDHALLNPSFSKNGQIINDEASSLYISWRKTFTGYESKILTRGRLDEISQEMETLYWDLTSAELDLVTEHAKQRMTVFAPPNPASP